MPRGGMIPEGRGLESSTAGASSHTWWERQARGMSGPLARDEISSMLDYFKTNVLCPCGVFRNVSSFKQVCGDKQPRFCQKEVWLSGVCVRPQIQSVQPAGCRNYPQCESVQDDSFPWSPSLAWPSTLSCFAPHPLVPLCSINRGHWYFLNTCCCFPSPTLCTASSS